MPGSHAPRPCKPGNYRPGRPLGSKLGEDIADERRDRITDELDLTHPPSLVYVEGRSITNNWCDQSRAKLRQLTELCRYFDLTVCEVDPSTIHGGRTRRVILAQQVPLNEVYAEIFDEPGISFEQLIKRCYSIPDNSTTMEHEANRKRAQAGLARLLKSGHISKLKDTNGALTLWPLKSLWGRKPQVAPEELRQLRCNQPLL